MHTPGMHCNKERESFNAMENKNSFNVREREFRRQGRKKNISTLGKERASTLGRKRERVMARK